MVEIFIAIFVVAAIGAYESASWQIRHDKKKRQLLERQQAELERQQAELRRQQENTEILRRLCKYQEEVLLPKSAELLRTTCALRESDFAGNPETPAMQ